MVTLVFEILVALIVLIVANFFRSQIKSSLLQLQKIVIKRINIKLFFFIAIILIVFEFEQDYNFPLI